MADSAIVQDTIFVKRFIIGNLPHDVTLEELYKALELHNVPSNNAVKLTVAVDKNGQTKGCDSTPEAMKLSLAVDKNGRNKRYAYLQVPLSYSKKLLKYNGCNIRGHLVKITPETKNSHLMKGKKWVKTYTGNGLVQTGPVISDRPIQPYISPHRPKPTIDPLYDMCAELTHRKFSEDLDSVLAQCVKQGIHTIVIPGRFRQQRRKAFELRTQFRNTNISVHVSTGIGPAYANSYNSKEKTKVEKECSNCWTIGPIGLDFRLRNITRETQLYAFEEQVKIACAKQKSLYLVEHESHKDFVDILTKYSSQLPKCAIVDFTGTKEELAKYMQMGFYIVITGSITRDRYLLTNVIVEGLEDELLPEKQILLASNAPRVPPENIIGKTGYRPGVTDDSLNKIPMSDEKSHPLNIFTVLELTAQYSGYETLEDIQAFARTTVQNSKDFLTNKGKRISGKKTFFQKGRELNIHLIVFAFSVFLLAIFVEYMYGLPEIRAQHFCRQTIF